MVGAFSSLLIGKFSGRAKEFHGRIAFRRNLFSSLLIGKFSGRKSSSHTWRRGGFAFSSLLIGKFSGSFQGHPRFLNSKKQLSVPSSSGSSLAEKERCKSMAVRYQVFQFPPLREVLWQRNRHSANNEHAAALSVPSSSGSSLAARRRLWGYNALRLSVPSSSGSSLAVQDFPTMTMLLAFQFPPHREVLWQSTDQPEPNPIFLFQFPPHREVLWQFEGCCYLTCRFSLSVPSSSGSSLAEKPTHMFAETLLDFQFPPHREVLWQSDAERRSFTSDYLSVPSSSGSSLAESLARAHSV